MAEDESRYAAKKPSPILYGAQANQRLSEPATAKSFSTAARFAQDVQI